MKFMKLSNPKIKKVVIYFMKLNFLKKNLIFQEAILRSRKIKRLTLTKCLLFREMELSSPNLSGGTLKSQYKEILCFLRASKNKCIH